MVDDMRLRQGPAASVAVRPPPSTLQRVRRRHEPTVWWVAAAALALMVASDWRLRRRDVTSSLSGAPDLAVVVEVIVYGALVLWLMLSFHWRPSVRSARLLAFAAWAFAVLYALTALYSPFPLLGLVRGAQLLVIAALAQAIGSRATRRHLHVAVHAFLLLVAAGVLLGLLLGDDQSGTAIRRFTWLAVHPVLSGTYLSLALIAAVAYLAVPSLRRMGRDWPPSAYGALALVFAAALFENRTRGAIVGALVGILMVLLTGLRRNDRPAVVPGALIMGMGFAALVGGARLQEYVERGQTTEKLTSLNFRTTLWAEAFDVWIQQPVTGQGLGATRGAFLESTGLGGGHNALINVLVDAGIVGAAAWLLLLVVLGGSMWRLGGRAGRQDRPLLLGMLACLCMNGVTTEGLGQSANVSMILLYVLTGWVLLLGRTKASGPAGP